MVFSVDVVSRAKRWWRVRRAQWEFPVEGWEACRAAWASGEAGYTATFGERVSHWRCWCCSLDDIAQDGWTGVDGRLVCVDCARLSIRQQMYCTRVVATYRGRMGSPRRTLGEVYQALVRFKERREGWTSLVGPLTRGLTMSIRQLMTESVRAEMGPVILAPIPSFRGRRPHVRMLTALAAVDLPTMDVRLNLLRKTADVVAKGLSRGERRRESAEAYALRSRWWGGNVRDRVVILTDDFMTTGATLEACAAVLRDAGAAAVYGATVVRVLLRPADRVVFAGSRQVKVPMRDLDVRGRVVILEGDGFIWLRFACGARRGWGGICAAVHTAGPYALPNFHQLGAHRWMCSCGMTHPIRFRRDWLGESRECLVVRVGARRPSELCVAVVQGEMPYV